MLNNSDKKWPILDFWYLIIVFLFPWMCMLAYFNFEFASMMALLLPIFVPITAAITGAKALARDSVKAYDMVKMNMIIKLNYVPAYILSIAIAVSGGIITIIFMGILVLIFDMFCSASTAPWGMLSVQKLVREEKIEKERALGYTVSQFVCYLDVIMAIILFVKVRKTEVV